MQKTALRVLAPVLLAAAAFCRPASAQDTIAEIQGRPIGRAELAASKQTLSALIIPPLFERFAAERRLVATPAEIDGFIAAMGMPSLPAASPEERAMLRQMASGFVLNWKVSKALYEQYGGDVIFQQANPLEPVGAQRRFLEDQERAGAFRILDARERTRFFEYFVKPQRSVIPPAEVDYGQPWWIKKTPR